MTKSKTYFIKLLHFKEEKLFEYLGKKCKAFKENVDYKQIFNSNALYQKEVEYTLFKEGMCQSRYYI